MVAVELVTTPLSSTNLKKKYIVTMISVLESINRMEVKISGVLWKIFRRHRMNAHEENVTTFIPADSLVSYQETRIMRYLPYRKTSS